VADGQKQAIARLTLGDAARFDVVHVLCIKTRSVFDSVGWHYSCSGSILLTLHMIDARPKLYNKPPIRLVDIVPQCIQGMDSPHTYRHCSKGTG